MDISFTLGIISSMNFCPPNPGSTVMMSTISTMSTNGSSTCTGVLGLIPIPAYNQIHDNENQVINYFFL